MSPRDTANSNETALNAVGTRNATITLGAWPAVSLVRDVMIDPAEAKAARKQTESSGEVSDDDEAKRNFSPFWVFPPRKQSLASLIIHRGRFSVTKLRINSINGIEKHCRAPL
jgi:hypothetical protein